MPSPTRTRILRPSGRPGPAEQRRSRNLETPRAGRCLRAQERHRWLGIGLSGNGSPSAIHPARTGTPAPSEAMERPASTLQDVPVSLDLSPEDFAGVPELFDFTLPGSDQSRHNPRENEASSSSLEGQSYRTRHERHKPPTRPRARREDSKSP